MSRASVKKTQQQFLAVLQQLEGKLRQLQANRESLDTRAFVVVEEVATPTQPGSGGGGATLDDKHGLYHGEVGSLVATATDILIKALQIKLAYVNDMLARLSPLVSDNPRQTTPPELSFSRYEEWLESNQQLFEFNSRLYELERVKFEMKQKQERVKQTRDGESDADTVASQLAHSSISQAQELLSRLQHQSYSSRTTHTYIHELLNPRGDKTTLESQKVQEYVAECFQHAESSDHNQPIGVHRDRYQEFMGVLCSYIVQKQKNWQREDISYELVYEGVLVWDGFCKTNSTVKPNAMFKSNNAVEHCVMPQIKPLIIRRVAQTERDELVSSKCREFSGVTQDQLRVRPCLRSNEPVPFIEAITQLRASYFSSTPTDKMYSVVGAAKALYDRLGDIGESSIDGDAFLDLWIYVIIKANIKDLATNLLFMIEYGNPQLSCGEAGYYLTTLEAAVHFITSLSPETLQAPQGVMEFVVCEREYFSSLCSLPGSGLEMVTSDTEIQGYQVAVIRDWALNRARLFRCALVPASYHHFAKVAVIRVTQSSTNPAITQFMLKQLRCEGSKSEGLYTRTVPLGSAICVNVNSIDRRKLIVLPTGDYDSHKSDLKHVLQLERLGSLQTDSSQSDSCLIYPSSVTRSQNLDIPMSPPYCSSTRGSINQGEDGGDLCPLPHPGSRLRRPNDTPSPLWSPYVLSQNLADDQVQEDTFTNQVGGMSVRSEHRRLRQSSRPTPDSVDTRNSKLSPSRSVLSRITKSRSGNSQGNSEITGSQSGNSEITRSQSGNSENTRSRSDSLQESHSAHPNIITIEAEIHEDCISSQPPTGHSENDRDESAHLLVDASDGVKRKPAGGSDGSRNLDLVLEKNKCGNLTNEGGERAQENGDANPDSKKGPLLLVFGGSGGSEMILTLEHRRELETAFITNHLYGNTPQSITEAAHTITLQAQMYLQRLNYLSVSYKITGEYDDITLNAVKTFQRAHNHHEAQFAVAVPESGHLSPTTYQYLRQAYITIYASMVRIGLDKYLGENFDPMSTAPRDMRVFRECVSGLQRSQGLKECQSGAMCANTIHSIRQLLHAQKKVTV